MLDSFYTPTELASRLVNHIQKVSLNNVIDFCIGDGELIKAAVKKWPNIECFGTDISQHSIISVKRKHPQWNLGMCDFLNITSQRRCKIFKKRKLYDLILINPPFSCIGGSIHEVMLDDNVFKVSTSMKFLVESLKFLSKEGCLYAIMPISVAYSQKDKKIWEFLMLYYNLCVLEIPNGSYFKNCSPTIIFISINDSSKKNILTKKNGLSLNGYKISIFRGKVSVHEVKQNIKGKYFIHSTNLRNNKLENLEIKTKNSFSEIQGPAILIPRVGNPNPNKICVIPNNSNYILSDCVIAIKTETISIANEVKSMLIENWSEVSELYKGTGARYITIERLNKFFYV